MPIRINLLAEQQLAEERRRQDPVKHGFWVAGFAVFCMLLWWVSLYLINSSTLSDIKRRTREAKDLEPEISLVKTNMLLIKDIDDKRDHLDELSANRFLWGSALNVLPPAMVDGIELTSLEAKQDFIPIAPHKEERNIPAKGNLPAYKTNVVVKASATEKLVLTIEGKCYGTMADTKLEQFRKKVKESDYFKSSLTNDALATLSQSLPQPDPGEPGRTFVTFTLKCDFPERVRQ